MSQPNGKYTIDRREGNVWVLEGEDGRIYHFDSVPEGAKEGDRVVKDFDTLTLEPALQSEREQIKSRMDRLFKKRR